MVEKEPDAGLIRRQRERQRSLAAVIGPREARELAAPPGRPANARRMKAAARLK